MRPWLELSSDRRTGETREARPGTGAGCVSHGADWTEQTLSDFEKPACLPYPRRATATEARVPKWDGSRESHTGK